MEYKLALSKVEKEVLYRKYRQNGLSSLDASRKIDEFVIHLNGLVKKLVSQRKTNKFIDNKFREEFEHMCMKLEV